MQRQVFSPSTRLPQIQLRLNQGRQYSHRYFNDQYHSNSKQPNKNRYSRYVLKQHITNPMTSFENRQEASQNYYMNAQEDRERGKNICQSLILPQTHGNLVVPNKYSPVRRFNTEIDRKLSDSPDKIESLAHSMMRRYPQKHRLKPQDLGYDQVKLKQYVTERINDKQYIQNSNMLQRFNREAQQRRKQKLKAHLKQRQNYCMSNLGPPVTLRIKTQPNEGNIHNYETDQLMGIIQQIPLSSIQPEKSTINVQKTLFIQNPEQLSDILTRNITKGDTMDSKEQSQVIKNKLRLLKQKNRKTEAKYAYVKKKLKHLQIEEMQRIQSNEIRLQRIQQMLSSIVVKIQENNKGVKSSSLMKTEEAVQQLKDSEQKREISVKLQEAYKQKDINAVAESESLLLQSEMGTRQQFGRTLKKCPKVVYSLKQKWQIVSKGGKVRGSTRDFPLDKKLKQLRDFHRRLQISQGK